MMSLYLFMEEKDMGLKDLLDDGIGKKIADEIGDKVDEAAIKEMVEKLKDKVSEEELVEFFGVTLEEIEKLKEHTV